MVLFNTLVTLIVFTILIIITYMAADEQATEIAIMSCIMSIIALICGSITTYNSYIAQIKKEQYNYSINYNSTTYYTNDYMLSNGGIEFEAEEGHFIFPVEGQELKIKKTKKGDQ